MEKINLTRWNFTDMRSPLLGSGKAKNKKPFQNLGGEEKANQHHVDKKRLRGFRWLEVSTASCGCLAKQNSKETLARKNRVVVAKPR